MISNKQFLLGLDHSLEVELVSSIIMLWELFQAEQQWTNYDRNDSISPRSDSPKQAPVHCCSTTYLLISNPANICLSSLQLPILKVFITLIENHTFPIVKRKHLLLKSHKHKKTHTNFSGCSYHYISSAMFSFVVSAIGITLLCIIGVPAIVFYFIRYSKRVMIPGLKQMCKY